MKRKTKIAVLISALLITAAVTTVLAYMFRQTETINTFTPAEVSCVVHEKLDGTEYTDGINIGRKKTDIKVQNTGNFPAYIRLKLVSYLVYENGDVVGTPSEMPNFTVDETLWLKGGDNTYYYRTAVLPNGFTDQLCDQIMLSRTTLSDGSTAYQAVEIMAEAIQAEPKTAAETAWGVVFNGNKIESAN